VLIVEHAKKLTDKTVEALVRYVRSGGKLLMTGMGAHAHERLRELCGVSASVGPTGDEKLEVEVGGMGIPLEHWLFRVELSTGTALLRAKDASGQNHPLLVKNRVGSGEAFYFATPLLTAHGNDVIPNELMKHVFETVTPSGQRRVTTDAPPSVEIVLRKQPERYVLHLVNMAKGERDVVTAARRRYTKITNIPPAPPCHVSLRLPTKPTSIRLVPQETTLKDWTYENGRLNAALPKFAIHQLMVVEVSPTP
jgi:hypothetical protein